VNNLDKPGPSSAIVALLSGAVSIVLTIAATLVSLRSDASKAGLFLNLSWIMMVSAGVAILILLWMALESLRVRIVELRHLRDIDSHVPRRLRIRRRVDKLEIDASGNATMTVECDVEGAVEESIPWMAFPLGGAAKQDELPWQSVKVVELNVDGRDYDAARSYVHRSRKTVEGDQLYQGLLLEEGVVRVPISLEQGKRKCHVRMVVEMSGVFRDILAEDACFVDISYVTNELELHVSGKDGFRIFFSPSANYRVAASQVGGEILDTIESQLQSGNCSHRKGIHWGSRSVKIGYRYELRLTGQEAPKS
jgi:hypothetical protein